MLAVLKRELKAYLLSPIGYVFMGFFLLVVGLFFALTNLASLSSQFNSVLCSISLIFLFVVPLLTMRLLSEEKKSKTDQLLLTSPLPISSVVVGKYLAAVCMFLLTIVLTFIFPIILSALGDPSASEIAAGYIGFFLMGCSFISVGLFMSALSENQVSAAASTFALLLVFYLLDVVTPSIQVDWLVNILSWFSIGSRLTDYIYGVVSLSSTIYYISFSAIFVFLTVRVLEKRRWSQS